MEDEFFEIYKECGKIMKEEEKKNENELYMIAAKRSLSREIKDPKLFMRVIKRDISPLDPPQDLFEKLDESAHVSAIRRSCNVIKMCADLREKILSVFFSLEIKDERTEEGTGALIQEHLMSDRRDKITDNRYIIDEARFRFSSSFSAEIDEVVKAFEEIKKEAEKDRAPVKGV